MSFEWRSYRLDEIGRIVTGKTPKSGVVEFEGDDVPFVTPADFNGSKWVRGTVRRISHAGAQSVKGSIIPQSSVLVTCIGSDLGKAAIADSTCVTNQQVNAIVIDTARFFPEFVYYNLSLRKEEIRNMAGGSAQPILNKSTFGQIRFDAPSLSDQTAIVEVLRPLDERIALLRETNATLEAIAQALFKSWFVDFDPVHAKHQDIAPAGMDEVTAALFPDCFEETAVGFLPKNWRVALVDDVAVLRGGKQLGKDAFDEHGVNPVYGGAGVMGYTNLSNADGFVISVGRVGAYCGQFFWHIGDAWINNNASLIKAKHAEQAVWLYQWFRSINIDEIKKGAAQPFVSNGDISSLKVALPPDEPIEGFVKYCEPIYRRLKALKEQAQTLAALRDTLLPRLISGQLRLPEAQAALTEAAT